MIGFLFACAGMAYFLSLIVCMELGRRVMAIYAEACEGVEVISHDAAVFPDYTPEHEPC